MKMNKEHNTNAESFEQCLKCTVCTVYCPMVAVNPDYPGPKQAGGRREVSSQESGVL